MNPADTTETSHKDNLFGICAALGEDFGFNPLWLRIALAAAFLFKPEFVVAGYFAAGLVVLVTRLVFPNPKPARPAPELVPVPAPAANETGGPDEPIDLPRAA